MNTEERQHQLINALAQIKLPSGISIRLWSEADFPAIQRLSQALGWSSPTLRPADSLLAWQQSRPALVATEGERVVAFVRGLTDGAISMYIAEIGVEARLRSRGIGRALLDACHVLYPTARLDLLATEEARAFYQACGFRVLHEGMRKSYL